VSSSLSGLAGNRSILSWTVAQVVESALPAKLACQGDKYLDRGSIVRFWQRNWWGVFLIEQYNGEKTGSNGRVSNGIFAQDILAQGCSLVEWILVLLTMMQCSCDGTLQGSW